MRASDRWTGQGVGMLVRRKLFKDEGKDQKGDDDGILAVLVHCVGIYVHIHVHVYTCALVTMG